MGGCERVHPSLAVYAHFQLRTSELSRLRSTALCQHFEQCERLCTREETPLVRREAYPRGVDTTRPASLTTNKIVNFWSLPPGTQNAPDAEVPLYPRRLHAALVSDSK